MAVEDKKKRTRKLLKKLQMPESVPIFGDPEEDEDSDEEEIDEDLRVIPPEVVAKRKKRRSRT